MCLVLSLPKGGLQPVLQRPWPWQRPLVQAMPVNFGALSGTEYAIVAHLLK
jgi:hypothetical protein